MGLIPVQLRTSAAGASAASGAGSVVGGIRSAAVTALLIACSCSSADTHGVEPEVSTGDVHRFVAAFAHRDAYDSACTSLRSYWDGASRGLRAYRDKFDVSFADLCASVRRSPGRYDSLTFRVAQLDTAATEIRLVYEKFAALHPLTNNPAVYLLVGNGIAGGTTTRGRHPIILIGTEIIKSASGLPGMVAHELVHTQQ